MGKGGVVVGLISPFRKGPWLSEFGISQEKIEYSDQSFNPAIPRSTRGTILEITCMSPFGYG